MELKETIKQAMEKAHGLSQGDRVIISCDYDDWDNGWEVYATMGTQERIHPNNANKKFYYTVNGWNIDNEENYQTPDSIERFFPKDEANRILQEMPKDIENPVYDTDCNDWVEYEDWVDNAVDFYSDKFYEQNIDDIENEFMSEKSEVDENGN